MEQLKTLNARVYPVTHRMYREIIDHYGQEMKVCAIVERMVTREYARMLREQERQRAQGEG